MFSKLIKLTFAITAYAPVLLIWWAVSVYSIFQSGKKIVFIELNDLNLFELFNKLNLIFVFLILVLISWYIMYLATNKLTRNKIEVKSIKSADTNMNTLIFSYFLPCIEIYNKQTIYVIGWFLALSIIIIINKGTYFYNPLMKVFGYSYYEIVTRKDVSYLMISKQKLKNTADIKIYSQLTEFVLLNATQSKT